MRHWLLAAGLLPFFTAPARAASTPTAAELVGNLQTLGIPVHVVVSAYGFNDKPEPQKLSLYGTAPAEATEAGRELHGVLARMSARQRAVLQFELGRGDTRRLEEAARLLQRVQELKKTGQAAAYPELVEAYRNKALKALIAAGQGAQPPPDEAALQAAAPRPGAAALPETLLKHRANLEAKRAALELARGAAAALTGAPLVPDDEIRRLEEAVAAIDILTDRTGGSGPRDALTHRALLTLVRAIPKDEMTDAQWQALASAFPMGDSINRMGVLDLWRQGITGRGVVVGVLDNGVDPEHPDLRGHVQQALNITHERHLDGPDAGKPDDRGDHGTHVAGTIHALAPEAEIRSYKNFEAETKNVPQELRMNDPQYYEGLERTLRCAEKDGCRVVNLSQGGSGAGNLALPDGLQREIRRVSKKGMTVVAAAGNEGKGTLRTPGHVAEALTVGAVDYHDRQAVFSSRNDVYRQGGGRRGEVVGKPDCYAYGVDVCAANFDPKSEYKDRAKHYVEMSGTSMASPHATAAVALMLQRADALGLKLTPEEIKGMIRDTSRRIDRARLSEGGLLDLPAAVARVEEKAGKNPAPPPPADAGGVPAGRPSS